jgi:hypothetical protein
LDAPIDLRLLPELDPRLLEALGAAALVVRWFEGQAPRALAEIWSLVF